MTYGQKINRLGKVEHNDRNMKKHTQRWIDTKDKQLDIKMD